MILLMVVLGRDHDTMDDIQKVYVYDFISIFIFFYLYSKQNVYSIYTYSEVDFRLLLIIFV